MRRAATIALAVLALLATLLAPTSAATSTPSDQLRWLVAATHRLPLSDAEAQQHFSAAFLTAVGGTAALDRTLAGLAPLRLAYVGRRTATSVTAVTAGLAGRYDTGLSTGADGRIEHLVLQPRSSAPHTWAAVDRRLRSLAPQVSFVTSRVVNGRCASVHALRAARAMPLGSAFKLYVLGALARRIQHHHARWNQQLAIREAWKSLPSGVLQDRPDGTRLSLREFADYMISISDNTAADHLLHFVGRRAAERQLRLFGNTHASRTTPFPTTRELFTLKTVDYPRLAQAYLAADRVGRRALLRRTASVPRSDITAWQVPRDADSIEWFGSPQDVCRAFAGLQTQAHRADGRPIGHALSINDGGLLLNPRSYPTVWFKGGSEPGVLTLSYLVRTRGGRTLVASVMLADPAHPIGDDVAAKAQAVLRGALQLAR